MATVTARIFFIRMRCEWVEPRPRPKLRPWSRLATGKRIFPPNINHIWVRRRVWPWPGLSSIFKEWVWSRFDVSIRFVSFVKTLSSRASTVMTVDGLRRCQWEHRLRIYINGNPLSTFWEPKSRRFRDNLFHRTKLVTQPSMSRRQRRQTRHGDDPPQKSHKL